MTSRVVVLCAAFGLVAGVAQAAETKDAAAGLARELAGSLGKDASGKARAVLVAPWELPASDGLAAGFVDEVAKALHGAGVSVVDRAAMKEALDEAALTNPDGAKLAEIGAAFGATHLLTGTITREKQEYVANARLVAIGDGRLVATGRAVFSASGVPPSEDGSLRAQIRRLADRVASGLDKLEGESRYQRFAIMPFEELGVTTKDKQLGLLVASELTTLLARDHGLILVERAQIKKVIDELALGQSGLVDESTSAKVGEVLGAQGLVLGSVSEAGDRYLVNSRVVAADTGKLVVAEDATLPAADLVALSSDAVVLRSLSGSIYRSILLPGWGQFYNREPVKGTMFIAAEVVAAGAAVFFHLKGKDAESEYNDLGAGVDGERYAALVDDAESKFRVRNGLIWGAVAIHALGVLDAFLSGTSYESPTPQ